MKYKDINDYYLVDMICESDDVSYDTLFNKYRPLIRNVAYKFYNQYRDFGYEYEDFIQEANVGSYKALKYFNANKDVLFYSFLSLCITRQLISFVNKISLHQSNYILLSNDEYDFDVLFRDDFEFLKSYDIDCLIKEVIYDSPLDYSCVFELKINNFTYWEIQELLDMNFSQAEYRYRKMRLLLKSKIENYLDKKTY